MERSYGRLIVHSTGAHPARVSLKPTQSEPRGNVKEPVVRLDQVSKSYGATLAVDDVSLTVEEGEFLSLLGPSGCGKSSTLRIIGGLEEPDQGRVSINGRSMVGVPPSKRPVNTVFQSYGLFPHMTVARNIAYGPRLRHSPKQRIRDDVERYIELLELGGLADRKPAELSGGQRQRVALARALINKPQVLLLDEPLAALDLQLRLEMQRVLRSVQATVGTAFVYVTHDQGEALSMSQRIAVMDGGRILQVGTPEEIYHRPSSAFVARFIGRTNLLECDVEAIEHSSAVVNLGGLRLSVCTEDVREVGRALLSVRPNDIFEHQGGPLVATVVERSFRGAELEYIVRLENSDVRLTWIAAHGASADRGHHVGDSVCLNLAPNACRILSVSGAE